MVFVIFLFYVDLVLFRVNSKLKWKIIWEISKQVSRLTADYEVNQSKTWYHWVNLIRSVEDIVFNFIKLIRYFLI